MATLAAILRKGTFIERPQVRSGEELYWHSLVGEYVALPTVGADTDELLRKHGWKSVPSEQARPLQFDALTALRRLWPDLHKPHPDLIAHRLNPTSCKELIARQPSEDRGRMGRWLVARCKALGKHELASTVGEYMIAADVRAGHPWATSRGQANQFLLGAGRDSAFILTGNESTGYTLNTFITGDSAPRQRSGETIRDILTPNAEWSNTDWAHYATLLSAKPADEAQFWDHPALIKFMGTRNAEADPANQAMWADRVRSEGIGALLGKHHATLQRRFLNEIPASWLDHMADDLGLQLNTQEAYRQLTDCWMALRVNDAVCADLILPAIRDTHPDVFADQPNAQVLSLWRSTFQAITDHIRQTKPVKPAELIRTTQAYSELTPQAMREVLAAHYGAPAIDVLISAGKLHLLPDHRGLPMDIQMRSSSNLTSIAGATTGDNNVYLIGNRITPQTLAGLFLHEVGEHAGLADMLGPDYGRITMHFQKLLREKDTYATWAAMRVPANTPAAHVHSEQLAYLVERVANDENARPGGEAGFALGQECLSNLRTWLFRTPLCRWLDDIGALEDFTLRPQDMASLAREAVDFFVEQTQPGTVTKNRNSWVDLLDPAKLDSLYRATPQDRIKALEQIGSDQAMGYLYALAVTKAPLVESAIEHFSATLAVLANGIDKPELQAVAGELLALQQNLDTQAQLKAQVDRAGFAMWIEGTSDPEHARLHFLTPSPKNPGMWQLNHYRKDIGAYDDDQYDSVEAALDQLLPASFMVPDVEASTVLQQWSAIAGPDQQTRSKSFTRWFGASQAVDPSGNALVLYHGTGQDISTFKGLTIWASTTPALANDYAEYRGTWENGNANVMPVYLKAEHPFDADKLDKTVTLKSFFEGAAAQCNAAGRTFDADQAVTLLNHIRGCSRREESGPHYRAHDIWNQASSIFGIDGAESVKALMTLLGFDSIKITENDELTFGVFEPNQVKSAIGNRGTFSTSSNDIRFKGNNLADTPAFKAWFSTSKIVSDDGNAMVLYRGTNSDVTVPNSGPIFFADSEYAARNYGKTVTPVYLNIANPKVIDYYGNDDNEIEADIEDAREDGHDGLIVRRAFDGKLVFDQYVAFEPSQVLPALATEAEVLARQAVLELADPIAALKRWAGNTQVVGTNGLPKVVFTGTGADITRFDPAMIGTAADAEKTSTGAFWFSDAYQVSEMFAGLTDSPAIMPVFLRLENPLVVDCEQWARRFDTLDQGFKFGEGRIAYSIRWFKHEAIAQARAEGRDGVIFLKGYDGSPFEGAINYAVFEPSQIKSAIGNRGTYDRASDDIRLKVGNPADTSAFKQWFDGSKVTDSKGSPLVVYHGTTASFDRFDREKITTGVLGNGFYFAAKPEGARTYAGGSRFGGEGYANGGNVMPVYLNLKNPLILQPGEKADLSAEAKGHDGVIQLASDGSFETLVAFNPEQIKSAIGNRGTFDQASDDIRLKLGSPTDTPAFKQWFANSKAVDESNNPLTLFHGTDENFTVFQPSDRGTFGPGIYFVANQDSAEQYGETIVKAHLSLQNPWLINVDYDSDAALAEDFDSPSVEAILSLPNGRELLVAAKNSDGMYDASLQKVLLQLGYDGVIATYGDGSKEYVAFNPEQVKSAIDNNGDFDPSNSDIRFKSSAPIEPPAVLYHGTAAEFSQFNTSPAPVNDDGYMGVGTYLTTDVNDAQQYALMAQDNTGGKARVIEVGLSASNPYRMQEGEKGTYGMTREQAEAWTRNIAAQGYDAIVNAAGNEWVALNPAKIITLQSRALTAVDSREFKAWFGDSKVVDTEGKALRVYHGTKADITAFDPELAASSGSAQATGVPGFYFAVSTDVVNGFARRTAAGGNNVIPAYLSIQNPAKVQYAELIGGTFDRATLENDGFDGVQVLRDSDTWAFIAFNSTQIKSAIGNRGTYDRSSDDIRLKVSTPTETPAFKRWFDDSKVVSPDGKPLMVYHGTRADFSAFRPGRDSGIHFGSQGQANAINGKFVLPVYLSIKNPKRLEDFGSDEGAWQQAFQQAKAEGFDGVIYSNQHEGVGDSWVAFSSEQIKSAIGNNGDFDPTNPDIRFSFAGTNAVTANRETLQQAYELAQRGISAAVIQKDTGWHRGVDGRWRFEISDDKATLRQADFIDLAKLAREIEPVVLFESDGALIKAKYKPDTPEYVGGFGHTRESALENLARHIARQSQQGFSIEKVKDSEVFTLDQVLNHPDLFAAYPFLTGMVIQFVRGGDPTTRGAFYEGSNRIELNANRTPAEILSTLLHEVQHVIQAREDFARGGNSDSAFSESIKNLLQSMSEKEASQVELWKLNNTSLLDDAKRASEVARNALKFDSVLRLMAYGGRDKPSGVFRLIRQEMQWIYDQEFYGNEAASELSRRFYGIPRSGDKRNAFIRDLAYDAAQVIRSSIPAEQLEQFIGDERSTKGMVNALRRQSEAARDKLKPLREQQARAASTEHLFNQSRRKTAYEVYRSLAGEVEARTTQARQHLTPDERRNRPVINDMDVSPAEAIVIVGGLELLPPFATDSAPSLSDNPAFSPDNADIRFSFAGTSAQTASPNLLAQTQARLAAGEDAEVIRKETGWFVGHDQRWRFEIDDSRAVISDHWYQDGDANGFPVKRIDGYLGDHLVDLHPVAAARLGKSSAQVTGCLNHPELFAAYPQLSTINVVLEQSEGYSFAENGVFRRDTVNGQPYDSILIRFNPARGGNGLGALLHEVQHAIQKVEGFARGGSTSEFNAEQLINEELTSINQRTNELLEQNPETATVFRACMRLRIQANDAGWPEQMMANVAALEAELVELPGGEELFDLETERFGIQFIDKIALPFEKYRQLAGEVEARNVQTRLGFDAQMRLDISPLATEDVSPDQVDVRLNRNAVMAEALQQSQDERVSAAEAGVLDMSREARLARAEALGFDTANKWYHGSNAAGFKVFDTDGKKNTAGTGAFFANYRPMAESYTNRNEDAQVFTGISLFNNPDQIDDLEIERFWVATNSRGSVEFEASEKDYDTAEQFIEGEGIELDEGDIVRAAYTIYHQGYEVIRHATEEEAIAELDALEVKEPGIYEVFVRYGDQLVIDWKSNNWDTGPAEPVWKICDEDDDVLEYCYSQEEADKALARHPGCSIVEDTDIPYINTNDAARQARDMGCDSVLIKNVYDNGPESNGDHEADVLVVFEPHNIRLTDAAFDPAKSASGNLLFSIAEAPQSPAFDQWFNGSQACNEDGTPLVVYRGEHGEGVADAVFQSRLGSLSFGDYATANLYATSPNNFNDTPVNPRVIPAYLSIKRPLLLDKDDPFIDFTVLIEAIGFARSLEVANELAGYISNTQAWADIDTDLSVSDYLDQNPKALSSLYVEIYPILDRPKYVDWLKAAGFDGAIYGGSGASFGTSEYRVFDPAQVLSGAPIPAMASAPDRSVRMALITQPPTPSAFLGSAVTGEQFTLEQTGVGIPSQYGYGVYLSDAAAVAQHEAKMPGINLYAGEPLTPVRIRALHTSESTPQALRRFFVAYAKDLAAGKDPQSLLQNHIQLLQDQLAEIEMDQASMKRGEGASVLANHHNSLERQAKIDLGVLINQMPKFQHVARPAFSASGAADYLNWSKPLNEQATPVLKALAMIGIDGYWEVQGEHAAASFLSQIEAKAHLARITAEGANASLVAQFPAGHPGMPTGGDIYRELCDLLGSAQAASARLQEAGVRGIRYLPTPSPAGDASERYVVFAAGMEPAGKSTSASFPAMTHQPGVDQPVYPMPLHKLPAVVLGGCLEINGENLLAAHKHMAKALELKIDQLEYRHHWLSDLPNADAQLVLLNKSALFQARHDLQQINRWRQPTASNCLPWSTPLSDEICSKLSPLIRTTTEEQITGEAIFHLLAERMGSNKAATDALLKVGIAGAHSDQGIALWDGASRCLAQQLSDTHERNRFHLVAHGSKHAIERFSSDKIGTGEGVQAFGYGLYFADRKLVAAHYQKMRIREGCWYENTFYDNPTDMVQSVAERLSTSNISQDLLHAARHCLSVVTWSPQRVEGVIEQYPSSQHEPLRQILNGYSKVSSDQLTNFFLMPNNGVRGLNEISECEDRDYSLGMTHLASGLHFYLRENMDDLQLSQALADHVSRQCDVSNAEEVRNDVFTELQRSPDDDYLQSRLRDCDYYLSMAKCAKKTFDAYGPFQLERPLGTGNLYLVDLDIKNHEYLRYDLPYSEQSTSVQRAIRELIAESKLNDESQQAAIKAVAEDKSGHDLLGAIAGRKQYYDSASVEDEKRASELLLEYGIQGIKYPDGLSRDGGSSTFNYVVFDDQRISILGHTDKHLRSESDEIPLYDWADTSALDSTMRIAM